MHHGLKRYCSTASLAATAQLGFLYPALKDTNFWFIPGTFFIYLFCWDIFTKDDLDRKRYFFGTDYGYAMIYLILISMLILRILYAP